MNKHRFCWLASKHTSVKCKSKASHRKYLNVYIYLTHSKKNTGHKIWTCIIVFSDLLLEHDEFLYICIFHPPKTHKGEVNLPLRPISQLLVSLPRLHFFVFSGTSFQLLLWLISLCRLVLTILNINKFWKGIWKKKKPCLAIRQLVDHVVVSYEFPLDSEVSVEEFVPRQVGEMWRNISQ